MTDPAPLPVEIGRPPFDAAHLDRLMGEAGIDILLSSSKHNVQYLLGGYRFIFFAAMDAIGHSRYLPFLCYSREAPEKTAYIANKMEGHEARVRPFWTPEFRPAAWGSRDAARLAAAQVKAQGLARPRIGIEPAFLPHDAYQVLSDALPEAVFVDATGVLEQLRAVKSAAELAVMKAASEAITGAMSATIASSGAGASKAEIIDRLRLEETRRGVQFEYCLLTLGASHVRASSAQTWQPGEVLSIDSGGNYRGYIGDICRMGVLGEPDGELQELLAQVEEVQQAAFAAIRAGAAGAALIVAGEDRLKALPVAPFTDFFAHGMGVITHEAPFLMTDHPVAYEGRDADLPLQAGMVLSVETTMLHPRRGFIKLEDTVAVTATGHEVFGATGRGWNRGGTAI